MFLSTGDFKQIVSEVEPTEVVKFINSTITVYDKVVEKFDKVNKVIKSF
jgi:hypothetical protein